MALRGSWGNGDVHGNGPKYLALFKMMAEKDSGLPISSPPNYGQLIGTYPEYFDGEDLSAKGRETIDRVRKILPCIWNSTQFRAKKR